MLVKNNYPAPNCPYCGEEMKLSRGCDGFIVGRYWYRCDNCNSLAPEANSPEEAYAAAMRRENKYREQVEYDIKAALNALNCSFYKMPYHIYSMLFDQISAIGYTPNCGADMRKEEKDEKNNS